MEAAEILMDFQPAPNSQSLLLQNKLQFLNCTIVMIFLASADDNSIICAGGEWNHNDPKLFKCPLDNCNHT